MNYDTAIIATLKGAPGPLTVRDLVALLDPTHKDWHAGSYIGLALTRLHRAGRVARARIQRDETQRRYYAYTLEANE